MKYSKAVSVVRASSVGVALFMTTFLVTGCQLATLNGLDTSAAPDRKSATETGTVALNSPRVPRKLYDLIPPEKINTEARKLAADGIRYLDNAEYEQASGEFNKALKLDIGNSYLHFLNAYAYHLRAVNEESQFFDLAVEGYLRALRFDNSNWFAHYYLAQAYMDQRQFRRAKAQFEAAAIFAPRDPDVLYGLASASYYARDPRTAEAALSQLRKQDMDPKLVRAVYQASAITSAALNRPVEAQKYLDRLVNLDIGAEKNNLVADRVDSWVQTRKVAAADQIAQFQSQDSGPSGQTSGFMGQTPGGFPGQAQGGFAEQSAIPTGAGGFVDDQMVVVDVTIIRTEEDQGTSKGINLLSGLQLQFGNPADGLPAYSFGRNTVFDRSGTGNDAVDTQTITSLIRFPGVTYSLNIANSRSDRNEVLARPTLVARAGQTSDFFSGVEVSAAATSGGAGDSISIEKEIGVKLAVTPEFLPDDKVLLQVQAERTFLTQPSRSVEFEFRLDTSKTTVNANVAMKFGQTLILSGLSERETEKNRDGVPFLEDIPGLQYFFSHKTTRNFRKSVLILLTPRRTQYLYESEKDRKKKLLKMSKEERKRSLFERRFSDWFQPLPHTAYIFEHLKTNRLYQNEFRTGDFPLIKWNSLETHYDRMKAAEEFLYY